MLCISRLRKFDTVQNQSSQLRKYRTALTPPYPSSPKLLTAIGKNIVTNPITIPCSKNPRAFPGLWPVGGRGLSASFSSSARFVEVVSAVVMAEALQMKAGRDTVNMSFVNRAVADKLGV